MPSHVPIRRPFAAAAATALAASALLLVPAAAQASPAGDAVVISEVYGGGGNSGAPYANDFVELHNPSSIEASLDGLVIEYRSAGGGSAGTVPLSGTMAPGAHYLVQLSAGSNADAGALPTPDATGNLNMSGTNGRVFLYASGSGFDSAVEGDIAGADGLVDAVGYGSAASFETAAAPALSNTVSAARTAGADTDDNSADFAAGAPTPQNSAGEGEPGGEEPGEEPGDPEDATEMSIAEANASIGSTVAVEGVVTADYRDGGFNGFTIQDPAGDPDDAVSDAIFVWGDRARAEIGQSVRVTGGVSVYNGLTEITVDAIEELPESLGEVAPVTSWDSIATDEGRAAHLSELVQIDGFTVTDNYDANFYGSLTLAYGDEPFRQPTDEIDPHDTAAIAEAEAEIAANSMTLDDGRSTSFNSQKTVPLSYLALDVPARVGSAVTFAEPVVLDYRYGGWRFQPREALEGTTDLVTFSDERSANAAPEDVGGDISLATFNVLNYFPTTAQEFVDAGLGSCTYYTDRDGTPVSADECTPDGPRGAANTASFERQQAKIVNAISTLDASIVSLEEIENSVHYGKERDFAVATLVAALNEKDGAGAWAFAASPDELPASEDVIRNAFIYRTAEVRTVGESRILVDDAAFDNAREPLVQAFAAVGASDDDAFLVATNHFKSKGSGTDDGTGQGDANPDRVAQAKALVAFVAEVREATGIEATLLAGDFNAYTAEDPIRELEAAGYTDLNSALNGNEATYNFDGRDGSLDHVLADAAALELVSGVDVWQINAQEQVGFEYSRFNYNATLLYEESVFRASDHNPILVGLTTPAIEEPGGGDADGADADEQDADEQDADEQSSDERDADEQSTGEQGADGGAEAIAGTDSGEQTADAEAAGDSLAVTGSEAGWGIAALAGLLLVGGAALVTVRRRSA